MAEGTIEVEGNTATVAEGVVEGIALEEVVIEDLLVEEVSIDGMCGVY